MGTVRNLTKYQQDQLVSVNDFQHLFLDGNGEYLRRMSNSNKYEVMYSPVSNEGVFKTEWLDWTKNIEYVNGDLGRPVIGHREDMVMMDDVTTKAEELKNELSRSWMYGVDPATKPVSVSEAIASETHKPSGILNFITENYKTPAYEEQKMVIGGDYCHLCGEPLLQRNEDRVYKKKEHVRLTKRYCCGTIYEETFKTLNEGCPKEAIHTHVILGDDCVEI